MVRHCLDIKLEWCIGIQMESFYFCEKYDQSNMQEWLIWWHVGLRIQQSKFKPRWGRIFFLTKKDYFNVFSVILWCIHRRFSRSIQLGGLGSVLDWRSHQGIRQSKLCYMCKLTAKYLSNLHLMGIQVQKEELRIEVCTFPPIRRADLGMLKVLLYPNLPNIFRLLLLVRLV